MIFEPSYLKLYKSGDLQKKAQEAQKHLTNCNLCPHQCSINRKEQIGFCRAKEQVIISDYGPHYGEEKPLVGEYGSGTIFFGYCNMKCVFCQNCELSFGGQGQSITNKGLAEVMVSLQKDFGCHNINFVTPTHFVPNILEALVLAVEKGLTLPLVYNCGGYERLETLHLLEDVIDIYMPDFKYNLPDWGERYSQVKDYHIKVVEALKEMNRQVRGLEIDKDGIAYRGLLIRHLIMPGGIENTKAVLKFIKEQLSAHCMVNLMDQYYPAHQAHKYPELTRGISPQEYKEALAYAKEIGIRLVNF